MQRLVVSLISTVLLTVGFGTPVRAETGPASKTQIQFYRGKQQPPQQPTHQAPSGQVAYQVTDKHDESTGLTPWINRTGAVRLPQTGEQITVIYLVTGGLLLAATGLGFSLWRLGSEVKAREKR